MGSCLRCCCSSLKEGPEGPEAGDKRGLLRDEWSDLLLHLEGGFFEDLTSRSSSETSTQGWFRLCLRGVGWPGDLRFGKEFEMP